MQTITLNPKVMFWGFKNTHLNFSNPGPITINFDALDLTDKKIVIAGSVTGKIEVSEELKAKIDAFQNPVIPVSVTKPIKDSLKVNGTYFDEFLKKQEENIETCKVTLGGKTIGTIIKNIASVNDVRKLQLMLKLEKENKQRQKIIDALEQKISFMISTFS